MHEFPSGIRVETNDIDGDLDKIRTEIRLHPHKKKMKPKQTLDATGHSSNDWENDQKSRDVREKHEYMYLSILTATLNRSVNQ